MKNQKGVIHLLLPLLLLLAAAVFALFYFGVIKNPLNNLSLTGNNGATVAVKTEYKNPFSKDSQYVNPFDQYKSPLLNLSQ